MTYSARETSADLGAPFELYEFNRNGQVFRYTSADRDVVWLAATYARAAISRSAIESGQEIGRQGIRITAPRDLAIVDLYRVAPPSDPVLVTIRQSHDGDPDAEFVIVWQGRILGVEFLGADVDIQCESVFTSLRRVGLRRAWQRTCPHVLYGPECRVTRASFQSAAVLSSVSATTLQSTTFGALGTGYLAGGYLEFITAASTPERRAILTHTGDAITIDRVIPELVNGNSVLVYPGCDHTTGPNGCARFGNLPNYGGTPFIPIKNPFGGDPLY